MMGIDSKLTALEVRKASLEERKARQKDWCLLDKVEAFVFDTTASNSGRLTKWCMRSS